MKTQHDTKESLSLYDNYKIGLKAKDTDEKFYFIFNDRDLLLIDYQLPLLKDLNELNINETDVKNCIYFGEFYLKDAYAVELAEDFDIEAFKEENEDINLKFINLYEVFDINEETYYLGGRAIQIIDWENNHQYCGRCGAKTVTSDVEMAKVCPECGFTSFTRICPAIITTIIKEDDEDLDENGNPTKKILMARHSYHEYPRYALIAGFLEAGESVEEAVKREVMEEVGIEVEDVQYFGSQSWPFPNSLMIGCICKYKSGEIKVDENEITKAKWFKKEEIEQPPSNISIFSRLLKNFKENY